MAYGRLDVFWPDGKFETFTLAQSTVSVGRSVGNTIMLDTDTISRYHFSIIEEGSTVYLTDMDSANGTYVDGVKVPSNERYLLRGGEEIQIGHLRMNYHTLQDAPTIPLAAMSEDTARIEKESVNFKIDLQLPHIAVTPGSYTSVELLITNKGDTAHTFTVDVKGIPKEWLRVNRPVLEIGPQDDGLVLINIKPLRRSDTQPGDYQTVVSVATEDNADSVVEAPMKVTILPFSGFGMALAKRRIGAGDRFTLHLHNQGSAPLSLKFSARDVAGKVNLLIQPESLRLEGGERRQVYFEVHPKQQRIFGKEEHYPIDVIVQSTTLPHFLAASRGSYVDRPPLPAWGRYALAGMAVLAALLFILGVVAVLGAPAPAPQIASFTVNEGIAQVPRGTPLELNWRVENVSDLNLEIDGEVVPLTDEEITAGTKQISTDELYGEIDVALVATNGDEDNSTRQSRTVNIYEQVSVGSITIEPETVVRDVVQTLTVSWEAPGAVNIEVSGLENIMADPPPPIGNTIQVVGIPENDFTIVVRAEDEIGGITEETLPVTLVTPQCAPMEEGTPLYAQTNTSAPPITNLAAGDPVRVNGIDASGLWLRFVLESGSEGWGERSAFACDTVFEVENLRRVVVATPTPNIQAPLFTVTPTAPLSVIPTATIGAPSTPIPTLSSSN